ncbi:MAG: response regulator [Candidatus Auribacterota bacterium]|jgi:PAS domain S-box-containing protein|nr:response regulator [Candidatus Auribacterota bacterium]
MSDQKFRISLIEDDENHTFLIKKALLEFKSVFEVDSFFSGQELFDQLTCKDAKNYDAYIIDYSLPKMNGLEVLKKLNSGGDEHPSIFVTNREDERVIHEALESGAYDYVLKKEGFLSVLPLVLLKAIDQYRLNKHRAEYVKNIKNLKEYFESVINTIPSAIIGLNTRKEVSYANLECQHLFFVEPSNLIGKQLSDIFPPDFIHENNLDELIDSLFYQHKPTILQQVRFTNNRNEKKILDIQIYQISTELKVDILIIIRDITRNIELEQKLFQTEKLAAFGKLLTGITHELNNRISPVLAYAQLLIAQEKNPRNQKWLKSIEDSARGVKSIVESLLYFSGSSTQHFEQVDIIALLENTLSLFLYKFKSKNIEIIRDYKENIPSLMLDKKQISKVFLNIITNSYEAMEERGGTLSFIVDYSNSACEVIIKDSGCGIPEQYLNEIFDPFFTTKTEKNNVGLGLSTSYNILQKHNGSIHISSEPGNGTVVILTFPLKEPVFFDTGFEDISQKKQSRVLIIDDDPVLRDVMNDILSDMCEIDIASDGSEAMTKISSNEYNAILTDIRMPGIDGPTLYRWIRDNYPGLENRVVFTTGDTYDPDTTKFLDSVKNPYVSKPFYIDDLKKIIQSVLV